MGPLDALWHVLNLFAPAVVVGVIGALLGKLLWRRELGGISWHALAAPAVGAGTLSQLATLLLTGRDGGMVNHAALVGACALALWWRAFGPGRR